MFNDVLSPFNSRQVNIPHLTMPVHRQNEPQSPSYLANDPNTHFIARLTSFVGGTFELCPEGTRYT
jgi:hypothetical protein